MEHKLNMKKVLRNDYIFDLGWIFSAVSIPIWLYDVFLKKRISLSYFKSLTVPEMIFLPGLATTLIILGFFIGGLILTFKRYFYLKSFEGEYKTVDATVVEMVRIKDHTTVEADFSLHGETFTKKFVIFINRNTRLIDVNSTLKLLVKNENPKKVLILDLYFD